jgi:hypothetical protein
LYVLVLLGFIWLDGNCNSNLNVRVQNLLQNLFYSQPSMYHLYLPHKGALQQIHFTMKHTNSVLSAISLLFGSYFLIVLYPVILHQRLKYTSLGSLQNYVLQSWQIFNQLWKPWHKFPFLSYHYVASLINRFLTIN